MIDHRSPWLALVFGALALSTYAGCGDKNGSAPDAGPDSTASEDAVDGQAPESGIDAGASVLQHHRNATRDGHYIDPLLTQAAAAKLKLDTTFDGTIQGPLWAQPLYVENGVGGRGTFYVADDNNDVYALDETTGKSVWSKTPLAMPAGQAGSGCGNVQPVGVTGTPIIDLTSRTLYLVTAVGMASGIQTQEIHALSIDDGSESQTPGWPIDVSQITSSGGVKFNPQPQGQRSALALVNGYLYVAFGGEDGDCGTYHGWVVSVPVTDPKKVSAYTTPAQGGGMWAVGGIASDGIDIFAGSGNATTDTSSLPWSQSGSEAILRFRNGTAFDPSDPSNYFTPSNWQSLDQGDTDLCGTGPLVFDAPGANPSQLVAAFGKSGVVHLLDRGNLGGVGTGDGTSGEGVFSAQVASGTITNASVAYTTPKGTFLAFHTQAAGTSCPNGGGDLVALQVSAASPPTFKTSWCASSNGNASPIVTTTDASGSNPIVWIVGAEGSNQLTGWDGETGAQVFDGGGVSMDNVIHFTTLIDVKGKLVVGSSDKIYVFESN